jgi:predicted amidohydrolase
MTDRKAKAKTNNSKGKGKGRGKSKGKGRAKAMRRWMLAASVLGMATVASAAPQRTVRLAICQMLVIDSDREGNFRRIEYALEQAEAKHADIAIFPESSILGWENPDAHRMAAPIPGRDSDRVAALVRCPMAGVDLVGEMTHGPWAGQTYGGSSFVADGTGKILLTLKDRDTDLQVIDVGAGSLAK